MRGIRVLAAFAALAAPAPPALAVPPDIPGGEVSAPLPTGETDGSPPGLLRLAALGPDDPLDPRLSDSAGRAGQPDLLDAAREMFDRPRLRGTIAPLEGPNGNRPVADDRDARLGGEAVPDGASAEKTARAPSDVQRPRSNRVLAAAVGPAAQPDRLMRETLPQSRANAGRALNSPPWNDREPRLAPDAVDLREEGVAASAAEAWSLPEILQPPRGLKYVTQSFSGSERAAGRFGVGVGYAFTPGWTVRAGVLAPGLFTGISGRF